MLEHLHQLLTYRELIRNLTLRDLKVRYRNSFLGFFWAWGNPVLMTGVFYFVFTVMQKSTVSRFGLFILIGWIVWSFTVSSINEGISSVVANTNLVKKIYFPREVLPAASVLTNSLNFLLALPLVLLLMAYYQTDVQPALLLYFPIIFFCQIALVMGLALLLSAIHVFYRDTGVITSVLLTAWFFLTPVFYPVENVTGTLLGFDKRRLWYIANPMASIIEAYRNILYGTADGNPPGPPDAEFLLRTAATCLAVLALGYLVFIRLSQRFGEEL